MTRQAAAVGQGVDLKLALAQDQLDALAWLGIRDGVAAALDLDAAYARDWSLSLDLKLMVQTPVAVFRVRPTT